MTPFLALVRPHWKPIALVAAVLLALSAIALASRAYQRHRLATAQARATAANAQAQADATGRYRAFQLDSANRAAERRQLLEDACTQAQRNEALSHFRPQLIDLPERPPVER